MNVVAIGAPILLGLLVVNMVGAAPQVTLQRRPTLSNATTPNFVIDADGDGLDDALEVGQHSAFDRVDTDGDGWNDAEELARGSLSTAYSSQPTPSLASLGARAYMRDGRLHAAFATYVQSGSLAGVKLQLGIYACHTMFPLPASSYSQRMVITSVPTHEAGQLLLVTDVVLPDAPLISTGAMSIYGTLQVGDFVHAAAAINLVMKDGTPTEVLHPNQVAPNGEELLGTGVLYRPLGGSQTPSQWSSGEICFQQMETVGSHGAVVTQEVTSASCVGGWDGYCDGANCSSSVGSTVDLIDPAALVGG